jgi:hypothetical protein
MKHGLSILYLPLLGSRQSLQKLIYALHSLSLALLVAHLQLVECIYTIFYIRSESALSDLILRFLLAYFFEPLFFVLLPLEIPLVKTASHVFARVAVIGLQLGLEGALL